MNSLADAWIFIIYAIFLSFLDLTIYFFLNVCISEVNRPTKKSSGGSTTPHSTPRSVKSGAASSRLNGAATGRVTPTPSGARTPTASKTPSGSRSGSPTLNRRGGMPGERNPKPTNVKQNRF